MNQIKPQELRIGNWVKWPNEKEPNEVEWAHGHWLGVFNKNYPLPEPIPLTEEWLKKFGFEEPESVYNFYHKTATSSKGKHLVFNLARCENGSYGICSYVDLHEEIWFVHQLQNVHFALTGEELKIVTG